MQWPYANLKSQTCTRESECAVHAVLSRVSGQPMTAVIPLPPGSGANNTRAQLWLTTPRGSTDAIYDTLSQVCQAKGLLQPGFSL